MSRASAALLALAFVLTAGGAAAGPPALPLAVVTTSTDLKALVEAVGGERVSVESLAPPLQDPHAIDVKPGQLASLKSAALLVRVGLDHEPWLRRALAAVEGGPAPGGPRDLDLSRSVTLLGTETPRLRADTAPHLHGFGNPHYWLDPENARPMTATIAAALTRLAPGARADFEAQRRRFVERLDAGVLRWRAALAPHRGARLVTMHDTWAYFTARFGLAVAATVEPTPGVPPSPAALGALVDRMRAAGVRVLVAEPYADPSLARAIATRAGARTVTLVPSVGGDPETGDYVALFDVNVARLTAALDAAR
ncbi:MAG TPA: metal ABC transporter substrate-binding protein [Methylomirabilota bacterium]|nr:metal ABC transporter substrate-binding protein [Methylomirabilota bacterium]